MIVYVPSNPKKRKVLADRQERKYQKKYKAYGAEDNPYVGLSKKTLTGLKHKLKQEMKGLRGQDASDAYKELRLIKRALKLYYVSQGRNLVISQKVTF